MKKIYLCSTLFRVTKDKTKTLIHLLFLSVMMAPVVLLSQQSYTFTNANATGSVGPTQLQINNAYLSTNLQGSVTQMGNGVQSWTVPVSGNYGIRAIGASGGSVVTTCTASGGLGANMYGEFALTAGQVLRILVGQMGSPSQNSHDGGGGGGSYVTSSASVAMVVGGGGGGGTNNVNNCGLNQTRNGLNASLTSTATNGANGLGAGGVNGNGGTGTGGSAGAGFLTNGTGGGTPPLAFMNGGLGGNYQTAGIGGFGGGGAGFWEGGNGGGGGGYSGGGTNSSSYTGGGGGGSYNSGQNQSNAVASTSGHGRVIINELCAVKIFASGSNSINPSICSGQSLTLTTTAVSNYTWSNNNTTTTSIVVAPTTTQTYSIIGTSSANCQAQGFITVTVSSGLPVLSIANPSNNVCLGKTVSLTATGALTYTWANPGVVNGQTFAPTSTAVYTVTGQNGCGLTTATTTVTVAPIAISVVASPTIVCEGYPSTLTAVAPVTNYTWMPGPLVGSSVVTVPNATTIYTVSATDGTCSGTQTLMLTTKTTPTITASTTNSNICEGDQVTIVANGAGTGGTYSWTPGGAGSQIMQTPLTTTVFAVAGTNAVGCTNYAQQVIKVNAAPAMNVTAVANKTLICDGQSTILNATGAVNYNWVSGPSNSASHTVTPTATSVYTVLGTHTTNSCVATRTISVQVITPSVTVSPSLATCAGKEVVLIASGATSYTWDGFTTPSGSYSITPSATTTFTLLTLTKVGQVSCPKMYTTLVNVNPNPTVTVTAVRSVICKGETNTLTVSGATSYNWGTAGTTSVIVVTPNPLQSYSVTGTDGNGCETTVTYNSKVSNCSGINESILNRVVSVFPNPSSGEVMLSTEYDVDVELFNDLGQHLRSIQLNAANDHQVKISDLPAGIYFLKSQSNDLKISEKIVITK